VSEKKDPQIIRSAGAMGAATFLSRIFGLVREEVFAFLFGAGNATDAFNVAFRIPNLLRDLFAEGAMSAALIPTFTQARLSEGDERAWQIAGRVFRALFVIAFVIATLGIIFASELMDIYAHPFHEVPGKFELAVLLTRIMFPFFPLIALAAAYMAILNSCGVFFIPAFASALFNITSVVVGLFLYWLSPVLQMEPIVGMAIGVVMGGAVQAFCQLPVLYKKNYVYPKNLAVKTSWAKDPALRKMLWLMIPGTIGLGATQINLLVNTMLATEQGTGAVSWLNYAFRLMQFPIGLFGVSLASATLPKISELKASADFSGFSNTLTKSLRLALAINLLAASSLAFLGRPMIELLFQYGRFHPGDTLATAQALAAYSLGLVCYSAVKMMVPACYALGNTRVPVISSVLSVIFTIILNLAMVSRYGFIGLALGTSLAAILNSVFLYVAIQRLLKPQEVFLNSKDIFKTLAAYLAISLIAGFLAHVTDQNLVPILSRESFGLGKWATFFLRASKLSIDLAVFLIVTVGLTRFVAPMEFNTIAKKIGQRFRRK
jgi:putative peptidoglycan lipid II flippase